VKNEPIFPVAGEYTVGVKHKRSGVTAETRIVVDPLPDDQRQAYQDFRALGATIMEELCDYSPVYLDKLRRASETELQAFVEKHAGSVYAQFVELAIAVRAFNAARDSEPYSDLKQLERVFPPLAGRLMGIYGRASCGFVRRVCLLLAGSASKYSLAEDRGFESAVLPRLVAEYPETPDGLWAARALAEMAGRSAPTSAPEPPALQTTWHRATRQESPGDAVSGSFATSPLVVAITCLLVGLAAGVLLSRAMSRRDPELENAPHGGPNGPV
jgi:hypothetical protein